MTVPVPARPAPPSRPVWPLYLLAGLAFIPFLGFFVGSVAVSWGLMSSRTGARRATAIAATGAFLNIIALFVLAGTMARGNGSVAFREGYRQAIAQGLDEVVLALEEYRAKADTYPASLQELQRSRGPLRPVQIMDFGAGLLRVPGPYQYVVAPDGRSYDLFSVGPDRKPGTDDDIRPVIPDSLQGKTGLRPSP
jgi:hypothetical protein